MCLSFVQPNEDSAEEGVFAEQLSPLMFFPLNIILRPTTTKSSKKFKRKLERQ